MKWNVDTTVEFLHMAKPLWKKYKSLMDALENFKKELEENPFQGDMLTPAIRKNQDGNNVKRWRKIERSENYTLTYSIDETNGNIVLLLIYDHNIADNVNTNVVKDIASELGYNMEELGGKGKLK